MLSPKLMSHALLVRRSVTMSKDFFGFRSHCKKSYLVDPASSHMLVSKIKPCMSKYKPQ